MTIRKALFRGLLALLAVAVLYLLYVTFEVWHYERVDQARKVDAIVVLGAAQYNGVPSKDLKARLDHAAALWKAGYSKTIVVTGGKQSGDSHTEAGASAAYLGKLGIPDEDVLREVQGRNSWRSLQAAAVFMKERKIHTVLLVSDPFHDARIREMASDLGLKPYVSPTENSPITGAAKVPYLMKEIAELSVGKLIGFERIQVLQHNI